MTPRARRPARQSISAIAGKGAMLSVSLPRRAASPLEPYGGTALARRAQRPRLAGPLRRPRGARAAAGPLRGAGHPRPADRRRLRLPLRPDRGARGRAAGGLRPDLPAKLGDPLLLHRHRRARSTPRSSTPPTGIATCASRCALSRCSTSLLAQGQRTFIEISPHPVLSFAVQETIERTPEPGATVLGTLRRDEGEPSALPAPSPRPTPAARTSTGTPSSRAPEQSASPCRPIPSRASATGWRDLPTAGTRAPSGSAEPSTRCWPPRSSPPTQRASP